VSRRRTQRWLAQDEQADRGSGSANAGSSGGSRSVGSGELREAKTRIRLLEQENEGLRTAAAYFAQANLPGK
jgi:hypothetical protein